MSPAHMFPARMSPAHLSPATVTLARRSPVRRSPAWLAVLVTLPVCLAGCGAPAATVDRAAFAHRVCTAITSFESGVGTEATAVSTRLGSAGQPPTVVRAQVAGLLGDIVGRGKTLTAALRGAGRPPGRGNQRFAAALIAAAAAVDTSLAAQQRSVAAASGTDATALNATISAALDAVQAADTTLTDGYNQVGNYADLAMNNAFADESTCADL